MHDPHNQHGHDPHGHDGHNHHGASAVHDDHGSQGVAKYLYVFLALTLLTTASFMTYTDLWRSHVRSAAVGWTFMMAVSCTKALLVMLFFMHLKWEASWKYVLTIPASVMAIFLMLALVPDVKWRLIEIAGGRKASHERLEHIYVPTKDKPPDEHGKTAH